MALVFVLPLAAFFARFGFFFLAAFFFFEAADTGSPSSSLLMRSPLPWSQFTRVDGLFQ
jgi:hypothetical protein